MKFLFCNRKTYFEIEKITILLWYYYRKVSGRLLNQITHKFSMQICTNHDRGKNTLRNLVHEPLPASPVAQKLEIDFKRTKYNKMQRMTKKLVPG